MTLLLSRIILTVGLIYGCYIIWTKNVDLILWSKTKIESILPVNKDDKTLVIQKLKKIQPPLSPERFVDAVTLLDSRDLFKDSKLKIAVSLQKKDGSIITGVYTGAHGRSAKGGYRYDLLTNTGASQVVIISDVDSVLKFEILNSKL